MKRLVSNSTRVAETVGYAGLCLFAAGGWTSPALNGLGEAMMLLAFLLTKPDLSTLRRDPLLLLSFAFATYLATRTLFAVNEFPDLASEHYRYTVKLVRAGFFSSFLVAFWLARRDHLRRSLVVLALALAGFVIRLPLNVDWQRSLQYLTDRPNFGMSINSLSFSAAVATCSAIIMLPRVWSSTTTQRCGGWLRIAYIIAAIAVPLGALILSQSRGSWLAAVISLSVLTLLILRRAWQRTTSRAARFALALMPLVLAGVMLASIATTNYVTERMTKGKDSVVLNRMARGKFDKIPMSSWGIRVHLNRYGFNEWLERPLFGWGPGSAESRMPELRTRRGKLIDLPHFHNNYLEILIQLGLVGFCFFALLALLYLRALRRSGKAGATPRDLQLLLLNAIGMFLFVALFYVRTEDRFGTAFIALIGGLAYSFRLESAAAGERGSTEIDRDD